jgi:hypothetical protein
MDNLETKNFVLKKGNNYRVKRVQKSAPSKTLLQENETIGCYMLKKLKPFRFAMITGLQRKGINTFGMKFKTIVATYYNEYSGYNINVSDFINNIAFKVKNNDDVSNELVSVRVQTALQEINTVIDVIINIFKEAKNKYDTAKSYGYDPEKTLKDEELLQAKAAKIVEFELLKKFKADHYMKFSEVNTGLKWVLGIAIVLYLLNSWK